MFYISAEDHSACALFQLVLRALAPEEVAFTLTFEFHFSGRGELESLRCRFLCFLLWHFFLLFPVIRNAHAFRQIFKAFDTDRVPTGADLRELFPAHPLKQPIQEVANLLKRGKYCNSK